MKITLATMGLFAALAVTACGGDDKDDGEGSTSSPADACKSINAEICSKVFGCFSKDVQDAVAGTFGNNEADCKTKLNASNCSEQMLKCDSGTSYDGDAAAECLSQLKSLSCDEFSNPTTATPAACEDDQICK